MIDAIASSLGAPVVVVVLMFGGATTFLLWAFRKWRQRKAQRDLEGKGEEDG